ncbi:hypothetical protein G6F46_003040 [Rhizopus delemar]|uniref:Helicase ATP-binding domain-containing protein n=2 Tax=Rhizopus TaxID=4842 RepID=A0A9P6Z017_9FUNG|nr:hypothetical protein G6F55_006393 [Rhizopus delemar]KAG1549264.1 hypothetical protein G6F51_003169 [Rhizopus arrhizus]KAG1504386.1 hypothetical protein G6F54_001051 [Rhizopus delemar]KAG1515850.1 hypothetical protein G6F53_002613 [Rhizopus delemar]KAG1523804.1 hypothetical protein G6F52_004722 [Rhizopus delemar]
MLFSKSHVFVKRTAISRVIRNYSSLRAYQKECIETSLKELKAGCYKQVVSLPVGSGKTVIMSNLIPCIPCPTPKATKVLLLAHRQELLNQAYNQIKRYNPNLIVEIDQGKRVADYDNADVIIASVPTLGRNNSKRIENLDPTLFKAILIDEAHHAVADSYLNILNYFNSPHLLVWGCSATVRRHDGLSLSDVFDKITFHIDFLDLIERGYLSPMKVTTVKTSVDLSHVRHSGADFALTQLSQAVNTSVRNEVIVSSWRKYAAETGRQSTLAFAVDIQHTQDLCNAFRQQGIQADFITNNFKRSGTAGLVTIPTLLGLSMDESLSDENILALEKKVEKETKEDQEKQEDDDSLVKLRITEYDSLQELMTDLSTRVEIKDASKNSWVHIGDDKCVLHVLSKGYLILEHSHEGIWQGYFKYEHNQFYAKPHRIPLQSDHLADAIRAADTWVQKKFSSGYIFRQLARTAPFRKMPMSEAQRQAIEKHKLDVPPTLSKGQAMDLLTKLKFGQLGLWKKEYMAQVKAQKEEQRRQQAAELKRKGKGMTL